MATLRRQFDVNVLDLLELTAAVLPPMRAAEFGVVISVSSTGDEMPFPLHFELRGLGVEVEFFEPGMLGTDCATPRAKTRRCSWPSAKVEEDAEFLGDMSAQLGSSTDARDVNVFRRKTRRTSCDARSRGFRLVLWSTLP